MEHFLITKKIQENIHIKESMVLNSSYFKAIISIYSFIWLQLIIMKKINKNFENPLIVEYNIQ